MNETQNFSRAMRTLDEQTHAGWKVKQAEEEKAERRAREEDMQRLRQEMIWLEELVRSPGWKLLQTQLELTVTAERAVAEKDGGTAHDVQRHYGRAGMAADLIKLPHDLVNSKKLYLSQFEQPL